ncbi:hypothetical protein EDF81_0775 [Enterobacter sp. BIGb0383]|uniref:hypothetical protein n=1 Tax=unclassified Enterobacter TaxID=2608935 RepID=UPI000F46D46F|nr:MULTISPECIES: hypothetical protein [unclassified Enterobacter]ROP62290.1 hypothetical protein EDF81_0775 [Enterobacter sp. BIGb0383]ROS12451.1 hypothetical protein EC848_0777 [Enterobacter sp. BIGb0359]
MADSKSNKTTSKPKGSISNAEKSAAEAVKKTAIAVKKTAIVKAETAVLAGSDLPTADALKGRFKAGSIPLQSDFADLIDMANIGRQAVGDNGTGWGLVKDSQGRLQQDLTHEYSIVYDVSPGSTADTIIAPEHFFGVELHDKIALLAVDTDTGPTQAVAKLNGDSTHFLCPAVKIDSSGQKKRTTVTIVGRKKVGVNLSWQPFEYVSMGYDTYSFYYEFRLDTTEDDFSNCTLFIDPLVLTVNLISDVDNDPVGEILSRMTVRFTCVGSNMIIPQGLISMFSGSNVPAGWALCNGEGGTPNLVDRFILGGDFTQSGKSGGVSLDGSDDSKSYKVSTDQQSPGEISIDIAGTALTASQLPPHSHNVRYTWNTGNPDGGTTSITVGNENSPPRRELIDAVGGASEKHTHNATASVGTHAHTFTALPAYYILAFIMKL